MTIGYSPRPSSWTGRNSAKVPTVISRAPIPQVVDQLRRAVYPHVARIANEWQQMLGESESFPEEWDSFRDRCHRAGQTTPTPILLKYGPGGFNALHRDLRGAVFFPIQLAVVLSPRSDLEDAEHTRLPRRRVPVLRFSRSEESRPAVEVVLGLGDAVLFCTRDRLVRTGGVVGLQAGQARRCPNHRGHSVRARRAVP